MAVMRRANHLRPFPGTLGICEGEIGVNVLRSESRSVTSET
jgi:hypothetical protein